MTEPWPVDIFTLYPEAFPGPLAVGVLGRAKTEEKWRLNCHQIRDFATDRHRSVDDTPAGGGPGMVMRVDILASAIDSLGADPRPILMASPRARPLDQAQARKLARGPGLILIAPRFEGYDERILSRRQVIPFAVSDAVFAGGEVACLALIEACLRLRPGVLGDEESAEDESFEGGLLEYAHYTRPVEFEGQEVPTVLRSGNHKAIQDWRQREREAKTRELRPDLWSKYEN